MTHEQTSSEKKTYISISVTIGFFVCAAILSFYFGWIPYFHDVFEKVGLTPFQGWVVIGMLASGMYTQWVFQQENHDHHHD
jgi:hypothetical protein